MVFPGNLYFSWRLRSNGFKTPTEVIIRRFSIDQRSEMSVITAMDNHQFPIERTHGKLSRNQTPRLCIFLELTSLLYDCEKQQFAVVNYLEFSN